VLLSYPGASPASANPYLRAKGRAEEALAAAEIPERVIVRSTHVYGPGSWWLAAMRSLARAPVAMIPGPGTQRLAPVHVEDVAAVLVGADARDGAVEGTFGLEGPDVVTMAGLLDLLAGRRRRPLGLAPNRAARLARLAGRAWSETMLEVLAADSRAEGLPDAAAEFAVTRTPLREGLAGV
jgi:NADH dehydrogenase